PTRSSLFPYPTLFRSIAALNGGALDRLDAVEVVEAAVCQDDARIDALASGDPSSLRVVAQVAALPLLVAAAQTIGGSVSAAWWEDRKSTRLNSSHQII